MIQDLKLNLILIGRGYNRGETSSRSGGNVVLPKIIKRLNWNYSNIFELLFFKVIRRGIDKRGSPDR